MDRRKCKVCRKSLSMAINYKNIMKIKEKNIKKNKGFVILFATVVSSIILLITTNMYNLSKKQVILSSYARESQRAFYVANSALECAFFYDISKFILKTSFPMDVDSNFETSINCGGKKVTVRRLKNNTGTDKDYTNSFVFRYPNLENVDSYDTGCAYVLVEKKVGDTVDGISTINTRITSVGFNTCKYNENTKYVDIPDFDDPTLLERRISSKYDTTFYEPTP